MKSKKGLLISYIGMFLSPLLSYIIPNPHIYYPIGFIFVAGYGYFLCKYNIENLWKYRVMNKFNGFYHENEKIMDNIYKEITGGVRE